MECKFCNEKMIKTKSYGDGWEEPIEEYFTCPNCHAELEYNQGYYENPYYWIPGTIDENKSDDEQEDKTYFIHITRKQLELSKNILLYGYMIILVILGYCIIYLGGI